MNICCKEKTKRYFADAQSKSVAALPCNHRFAATHLLSLPTHLLNNGLFVKLNKIIEPDKNNLICNITSKVKATTDNGAKTINFKYHV